jgi:muramoyltetrapeptide carboxypeptidase
VLIKPKGLKKGDTIGIVSPSSGLWKRSELWQSIEELERLGYRVRTSPNAYSNDYYLAGSDENRAKDLMDFFKDDSIDAIFASQGGYGASRILRMIDYDVIKANPKIFLGYSDITALHLAINKLSGLITFHGPSATSFGTEYMNEYRFSQLEKAICNKEPIGDIKMASKENYLVKMNPQIAQGQIIGGNLSLIISTLGTPYEIDTKGKILFFEDLDTEPWIMDHMITHLLNSGKLHDAVGIVVGECSNCEPNKFEQGFQAQKSLEDVLFDLLEPIGKPVLYGLPIGHTKDLATIPIGVQAQIDSEKGTLKILERATIE